jgi:hypothetical protein
MATLQSYRAMLRVDRNSLDDELEIQAEKMDQISQQVNLLNSKMLKAKEDLLRTEARLAISIVEDSSAKMTAGQIDASIKRHRDRQEAWEAYEQARFNFDEWESLRDAWKQRGFSIKTLADLYTSQYFSIRDHQPSDKRDREGARIDRHQRGYDERRAAMREARAGESAVKPRRRTFTGD